jgi:uroporphyrinogen decarboxylase
MHFKPVDRCPMRDLGFWDETLLVWHKYGLPQSVENDATAGEFFGVDPELVCGGFTDLCPYFEEELLEDRGDSEIVRDLDGVVVERGKIMSAIPKHLDHLVRDRESWEKHYKPRMRPDDPRRFPSQEPWTKEWVEKWTHPDRDCPLFIYSGSLYGRQRQWFGLVRVSEIIYDDPGLFEEIVETCADIAIALIERICGEHRVRPEAARMWEDMCYSAGPLISPRTFKQVLVPHYRRIVDTLHRYGVDVVSVDSDGKIDKLVPLWLEAGVNCMLPLEIGTWGADPIEYRKEYGRDLLMMGAFNKRILAARKSDITAEVERLAPLVEEGGFIPFCDHLVPPDVPLSNYIHYLKEAKRVWGRGLDNLNPTGEPDWENAEFKEANGYTWDPEELGLAAV